MVRLLLNHKITYFPTSAHPQWREATQVHTVQLCIFLCQRPKSSHRNAFLWKATSMQDLLWCGFSKDAICRFCDFSSIQRVNLTNHLLTHSGEKPHQCKKCGRSFNQAGTLNSHIRVHTGEKRHKCKWCDFASITKSDQYQTYAHPLRREVTSL